MFDGCTTGDTAHIDTIFKFLPHTCQHFPVTVNNSIKVGPLVFLLYVCNHREHYETCCICHSYTLQCVVVPLTENWLNGHCFGSTEETELNATAGLTSVLKRRGGDFGCHRCFHQWQDVVRSAYMQKDSPPILTRLCFVYILFTVHFFFIAGFVV